MRTRRQTLQGFRPLPTTDNPHRVFKPGPWWRFEREHTIIWEGYTLGPEFDVVARYKTLDIMLRQWPARPDDRWRVRDPDGRVIGRGTQQQREIPNLTRRENHATEERDRPPA